MVVWRTPLTRFINPLGTGPIQSQRFNPNQPAPDYPHTTQSRPFDQHYYFLRDRPASTTPRVGATPAARPRQAVGTTDTTGTNTIDRLIDADVPITVNQTNPKQAGSESHQIYERFKPATTMQELIRLGGTGAADLRKRISWDMARGYVRVRPDHAPATANALARHVAAMIAGWEDLVDPRYASPIDAAVFCLTAECPAELWHALLCETNTTIQSKEKIPTVHVPLAHKDALTSEAIAAYDAVACAANGTVTQGKKKMKITANCGPCQNGALPDTLRSLSK